MVKSSGLMNELFDRDYEMKFVDNREVESSATNSISPRTLPKTNVIKKESSSATVFQRPIQVDKCSTAIRMRNFSFPNDLQLDGVATQTKNSPKIAQRTPSYSAYSNSNSVNSSPRRSSRSETESSIFSVSSYMTYVKNMTMEEELEYIKRENESETLFNQLRNFEAGEEVGSKQLMETDPSRLKYLFWAHSRKASFDSPTKQLQETNKRRSSSLISNSNSLSSSNAPSQGSPRTVHHQRASALKESPDAMLINQPLLDGGKSDTDLVSSRNQTVPPSANDRKLSLGDNFFSRKHSLIPSPKLTIENTKEQIRRNSNGTYNNYTQFSKLNGLDKDPPVFACLPETGDVPRTSIINLDLVNDFKHEKPLSSKKYKPHFEMSFSPTISEENSSSDSLRNNKLDEMVTLIEFLKSE